MYTPTIQIQPDLLKRYLTAARSAGVPGDQAARFVDAGYIAQPRQLVFHAAARWADQDEGPLWVAFGGSRGPGKSHATYAQVGIDDCQRYPGLKFLFLRKVQKSASESIEDLTTRVLGNVRHSFSASAGRVEFPNGSRILIGGYKDERDIDKYVGIEYDGAIIEEFTQISEKKITLLRGSIRSSRTDGWRPRIYPTTNPGGVGHTMFKREFVLPSRERRPNLFLGGLTVFIPATYRDNKFLDQAYISYLEAIPGQLGRAWRDGDWDAFEGMLLPAWSEELHVIDSMDLPPAWPRWRAIDWGSAKPFSCHWYAMNPDNGRIYVYREIYQAGMTDRQQARVIKEMTLPGENIQITFADPAMWTRKNVKDLWTTTADEYRDEGVPLTKADNDRIGGKRKVERLLANLPDGRPGLQVFRNCRAMIETLANLPSDPNNPEDADTDAEDHAYDDLRYALTNIRQPAPPAKPQRSELQMIKGL